MTIAEVLAEAARITTEALSKPIGMLTREEIIESIRPAYPPGTSFALSADGLMKITMPAYTESFVGSVGFMALEE